MTMRRFTETTKWRDPWFMELPTKYKLLWQYLCDCCDNAGVWVVNERLAHFETVETYDWAEVLRVFADRVVPIHGGRKWHLIKFVAFQYPRGLSLKSPPQKNIIQLLALHGMTPQGLPMASGSQGEAIPMASHSHKEEEEDKEEDQDQDVSLKRGVQRGDAPPRAEDLPPAPAIRMHRTLGDLEALNPTLVIFREDRDRMRTILALHGFESCQEAINDLKPVAMKRKPDKRRIMVSELAKHLDENFTLEPDDYRRAGLPIPKDANEQA